MTKILVILSVFALIALKVSCDDSSCILKIDKVYIKDPLLLNEAGELFRLQQNNNKQYIKLENEQFMKVICTGESNEITKFGKNMITLMCVEGSLQDEAGIIVENSIDLLCKAPSTSSLEPTTRFEYCSENHASYQIGFNTENNFLNLISICRNDDRRRTQFTYSLIKRDAYITSYAKGASKIFEGDDDDLYKNSLKQLKNIEGELELNGAKFDEFTYFLSRGHITANSDMVFSPEMRATYYYHNAAPQWQGFNGGNWNNIETEFQKYLFVHNLDVVVFTGVYGTLALNKKDGTTEDIYLDMDNKIIPVPEFFWKVTQESDIAVVGYNNVFVDETEAQEKANSFCNVADCVRTGWLNLDTWNKAEQGFIFCCEKDAEFLNKIELNLDQKEMFRFDVEIVQDSSSIFVILMLMSIFMMFLYLLYQIVSGSVLVKRSKYSFELTT